MSQDFDQLSNDELNALAATEIMGWHFLAERQEMQERIRKLGRALNECIDWLSQIGGEGVELNRMRQVLEEVDHANLE